MYRGCIQMQCFGIMKQETEGKRYDWATMVDNQAMELGG